MARTPDPTGLSEDDAASVRDTFDRVRKIKRVTNEQVAERLGWDVRKVTDSMTKSRTLLADNAIALLRAIADEPSRAGAMAKLEADRLLLEYWQKNEWPAIHAFNGRPVAAVIPRAECKRLAAQMAEAVGRTIVSIGAKKKYAIALEIEKLLRAKGPDMARTWYEIFSGQVSRIIQDTVNGEGDWVDALPGISSKSKPSSVARESVYLAAAIGFPKGIDD